MKKVKNFCARKALLTIVGGVSLGSIITINFTDLWFYYILEALSLQENFTDREDMEQ